MNSATKKLSQSLTKLHSKEAEQYNLITGDFLTYKMGESYVVGNEVITPVKGKYRLTSSGLDEHKRDIGEHFFTYLQAALTYSVAQQRGWFDFCLKVKDYDNRLANAEHDVAVFGARVKTSFEQKQYDKNAVYAARLSAAKTHYAIAKAELAILSKKAKYMTGTKK